MFRSEEMSLCQLILQPETAYTFISTVGESSLLQFIDLNADMNEFKRKFVGEVRRCEEMGRRLRAIKNELKKANVPCYPCYNQPSAPNAKEATSLEFQLEQYERDITELSMNALNLKSNYTDILEYMLVIEQNHLFFTEVNEAEMFPNETTGKDMSKGSLGYTTGLIRVDRIAGLQRMLWRISKGNIFFKHSVVNRPIEEPLTGNTVYKGVFIVFFQGEELRSRVEKVCKGYHAAVFDVPDTARERSLLLDSLKIRLSDLNMVMNKTVEHRQAVLHVVSKEISIWSVTIKKMLAVYHMMNYLSVDLSRKCLIGECWVATSDIPFVIKALIESTNAVGSSTPSVLHPLETKRTKPTYFRCNKFTQGFQNLIDAYGIASYQEVNPALYSVITFPFLFAVMFGDLGHGLILTLFSAFVIMQEKKYTREKSQNEIWNIFFGGRYIILLMGLFSMYTGIIYNDIFSKSLRLFDSSWNVLNRTKDISNSLIELDPGLDYVREPYPFGMDPIWMLAENKILYFNSYKMKLSIIFGVIHMLFGVVLSIPNHIHFKNRIYILLEFLPQFLFLLLLFFYLVILMFMKWIIYYYGTSPEDYARSQACAPLVLILYIKMMMFSQPDPVTDPRCKTPFMYPGQGTVQTVIMVIALLCIPVILIGKPLYLLVFRKKYSKITPEANNLEMGVRNGSATIYSNGQGVFHAIDPEAGRNVSFPGGSSETLSANDEMGTIQVLKDDWEDDPEHEAPGEIIIHQAIHTIEYVLSTISHTASYLRLWALSLAHGQLSDVLWSMVFRKGLIISLKVYPSKWLGFYSPASSCLIYLVFAAWATLTVAILVIMEGLSAFLHTLRLHWVEFMSKFFTGTGYAFQPFSFKKLLEEEDN